MDPGHVPPRGSIQYHPYQTKLTSVVIHRKVALEFSYIREL